MKGYLIVSIQKKDKQNVNQNESIHDFIYSVTIT